MPLLTEGFIPIVMRYFLTSTVPKQTPLLSSREFSDFVVVDGSDEEDNVEFFFPELLSIKELVEEPAFTECRLIFASVKALESFLAMVSWIPHRKLVSLTSGFSSAATSFSGFDKKARALIASAGFIVLLMVVFVLFVLDLFISKS